MYDKILSKMSEVVPVKNGNEFYVMGNQWVLLLYKFGLVAKKCMDTNLVLENDLDDSSVELVTSDGLSNQDLFGFTAQFPSRCVSHYTVYMGKAFKLSFRLYGGSIKVTLARRSGIMSELRDLCIKNNWFTCGSNRQYTRLFDMARDGANVHDLTLIIWLCSDDADKEDIYNQLKALGYK